MALDPHDPVAAARALLDGAERATLATRRGDGWPYASLVLIAFDDTRAPLLLLSELADHTAFLRGDPRVSLLIDGTAGFADTLAGPRLTLLGEARRTSDPALRDRYLTRHPSARQWADFGDFGLWRVTLNEARLVAGFGRIRHLAGEDLAGSDPRTPAAPGQAE